MGNIIEWITGSVKGFKARHERVIFTTVARMLALVCMAVAAFYAVKLAGQIYF